MKCLDRYSIILFQISEDLRIISIQNWFGSYLYFFPAGSLDHSLSSRVAFSFLTGVLSLFSFTGNSSVIHVVRKNQNMKSTTYLLILNMACGDLLIASWTGASLIKYLLPKSVWPIGSFGIVLCETSLYIGLVSFLACIFSLVGITIDRFMAVSRPLKHKSCSKWTKITIPVIWQRPFCCPLVLC